MDRAVLLAQLHILLGTAPDFDLYSPISKPHQAWLAKGHALISRWNTFEAISFKSASNSLHLSLLRDGQVAAILGIIHRAIADLELERPQLSGQAFEPGAVYDFFKALSSAVGSATSSLFIVDPYLDAQIFDTYLAGSPVEVSVRLLARQYASQLKPAVEKYIAQTGQAVEVRTSPDFHDRVVFIDDLSCWVMGQSLKDAANSKPTYLSPLAADISALKLSHYEAIWSSAVAL